MSDSARNKDWIDLSPAIGPGTTVWPGDLDYQQEWSSSMAQGDLMNVAGIKLSPHTGSHADAPLHVREGGADAADLSLDAYWGPARLIEWRGRGVIDEQALGELDWSGVERVLFRTRAEDEPLRFDDAFSHFTPAGARFLVSRGLRLVGIDTPSVDSYSSKTLEVHHVFLGGGVAILEILELGAATPGDWELCALPLRLRGADASPVRAVLRPLR